MLTNFKRKTVDSVLAQFNATIADLNAIADEQAVLRDRKAQEARDALAASKAADLEAGRALTVANKIKALVS